MANIRFWHDNKWDDETVVCSSEHPNWVCNNTQQRWKTKTWRSRYGNSSGWGTFVVSATSNKIYIDEGGGSLICTLSIGSYNADTLSTEIETQLEATGALDYSVFYNDTTNKFEIYVVSSSGTVILELATTLNSIWTTIGFNTGVDTAALGEHIADNIKIHTAEWIKINGSAIIASGVFLVHTNAEIGASVYLQGSNDDFVTTSLSILMLRGRSGELYASVPAVNITYDDYRIWIENASNPDGYIEIGRVWVGVEIEPDIGTTNSENTTLKDESIVKQSENGQVSTIQRVKYEEFSRTINHVKEIGSTDRADMAAFFSDRGLSKEFIVNFKPPDVSTLAYTDYEEHTYYVRFASYKPSLKKGVYSIKMKMIEER